jgi:fucose 4-O-acetylase-like acetyltransferase
MGKDMQQQFTKRRLQELDFLKGVLIVLVISFHLVFIEQKYPYAKQVVYAFHMPAFLLVSGYLMNIGKPCKAFLRTMLWFTVPYIVMESGYVVMAAQLSIAEHIDVLTLFAFLEKLLLHPIGPYWYLQTLIICGFTYYAVFQWQRISLVTRMLFLALLFWFYASTVRIVSLPFALYFLGGILLRQSGLAFVSLFPTSWLTLPVMVLLVSYPQNFQAESAGSVFIVWLAVANILLFWRYSPSALCRIVCYLGRNTLPLFLFSPMFTLLCKQLVPFLQTEPTGLLFLAVALMVCTFGSLCVGKAMDALRLSSCFCGRKRIVMT